MVRGAGARLRELVAGEYALIRVDAWWMATGALDMRAGMQSPLARVIEVFGQAIPHHAYLFANRRGTRLKILIHDGQGLWLACRQLHQGRFHWHYDGTSVELDRVQFDALVLGLPWQQLAQGGALRLV